MRCAACGSENEAGRKFCGECGNALSLPCPACGSSNTPGVKFCGECGAQLGSAPAAVPAERESPASERRLVSVLFADLVGFTALSESRDAEARFRARLAAERGETEEAERRFKRATGLFCEIAALFYLAVTQLEQAEWLAGQGRADEAEPLLAEAGETFEQLGATPWLERAGGVRAGAEVRA